MAKKKIEDNSNEEVESRLDIYEVGYLLVPTIAEENVGGEVTTLKDNLSSNGASFISEEFPKFIDLAYEMSRLTTRNKSLIALILAGLSLKLLQVKLKPLKRC